MPTVITVFVIIQRDQLSIQSIADFKCLYNASPSSALVGLLIPASAMSSSANSLNSGEVGSGFKQLYSSAASMSSLSIGCLYDRQSKTDIIQNMTIKTYLSLNCFDVEENTEHLELPLGSVHSALLYVRSTHLLL